MLALTFTVRAAGELRGRLRELGATRVRATTFHAAALRQLNYFWPRVIGGRPPHLIDSKLGLIREAAKEARVKLDTGGGFFDTAAEIEWAKTIQVRADFGAEAAARAGRTPRGQRRAGGRGVRPVRTAAPRRHQIDFESVGADPPSSRAP